MHRSTTRAGTFFLLSTRRPPVFHKFVTAHLFGSDAAAVASIRIQLLRSRPFSRAASVQVAFSAAFTRTRIPSDFRTAFGLRRFVTMEPSVDPMDCPV